MATIKWTIEAERWLHDIYSYIAADNPRAAAQTVEGIYERAQLLREFPETGHRYEGSKRHVRILLYGHYRITYLVTEQSDVEILGIFTALLTSTATNSDWHITSRCTGRIARLSRGLHAQPARQPRCAGDLNR